MLLIYSLVILLVTGICTSEIINKKVDRTLDLSTQIVRQKVSITFENTGSSPITEYNFILDEEHRNALSYLTAEISKKSVPITKVPNQEGVWKIDLTGNQVSAGATSPSIDVSAVFTHLLKPYPEEITQAQRQLVRYRDSHYLLTPYTTKSQTLKVKLPTSAATGGHGGSVLESYTKLKTSTAGESSISFGPYLDVSPNSVSELVVHYENNSPFTAVENIDRTIEVSMWLDSLSVVQKIDIVHTGAKLKGGFSRYDYQREPTNGISAVKNWRMKLPNGARDVYYRDEIGNISTSNLRTLSGNRLVVDLKPRFPLFGGWKTHYLVGYRSDLSHNLFSASGADAHMLRVSFVDHLFDNMVIDKATVTVLLPEGSSDVKVRLPYSANREKDSVSYTYLDVLGRPQLTFHKNNLVEDHIQNVEIEFTYKKIFMAQEPILIGAALAVAATLLAIYSKLNFSISPAAKVKSS